MTHRTDTDRDEISGLAQSLRDLVDTAGRALPAPTEGDASTEAWASLFVRPGEESMILAEGPLAAHARLALTEALETVRAALRDVRVWPLHLHDWSVEVTRPSVAPRSPAKLPIVSSSGDVRLKLSTYRLSLAGPLDRRPPGGAARRISPDIQIATAIERLGAMPRRSAPPEAWRWFQIQGYGVGQTIPALDAGDAQARFAALRPFEEVSLHTIVEVAGPMTHA